MNVLNAKEKIWLSIGTASYGEKVVSSNNINGSKSKWSFFLISND